MSALSPEQVLRAAQNAVRDRDVARLLPLIASASLSEWAALMRRHGFNDVFNVEESVSRLGPVPTEAKESFRSYCVAQRARVERHYGVASREELDRLTDVELLEGALRSTHPALEDLQARILGHILDGDKAYVLWDFGGPAPDNGRPQSATLLRESGTWRISLEYGSEAGIPGIPTPGWGWVPSWRVTESDTAV